MAIGIMSLLGFQLVDSAFVAHLGTRPLAAQSFTFPITFLMIGVQVGLGIAIAALISQTRGAGESQRSQRLSSLVLVGGSLTLGIIALALWFGHRLIFTELGAHGNLLTLISAYWAPQLFANWLGAVLYFFYTLYRAHGNTRLPGTMMVATSLMNLALDPIFIFGVGDWQGFGLPGAAVATIASFGTGLLFMGTQLSREDWLSRSGLPTEIRRSAKPFATIAGPAMISQLMPPLSAMLATGLLATLGNASVAAWGVASRLETVSLMVVLGLTMSLPPWLGHCYGAGHWVRIRALMRVAQQTVVVWQLVFGVAMAIAAPWLATLLTHHAAVADRLTVLIRFLLPSYALLGVCMLVVSAANALGWPMRAMLMSFARLFICYLPFVALGVLAGRMDYVALGAAFGNVLAGAITWFVFQRSLLPHASATTQHT
ncbi:MATE family efflux transporter [Salinisphaera sp. USBA-960]|uniref:MATE family efflux transporter n=1 Tax=Salinisphaera orenii TaxID=856731 RepID=UPI000DBE11D0|nr:MATE family efflux transporter [Salifodinibacter halophilus]NNC26113.1 MATE family efflux transporter [Salifodinibacter halophilus]